MNANGLVNFPKGPSNLTVRFLGVLSELFPMGFGIIDDGCEIASVSRVLRLPIKCSHNLRRDVGHGSLGPIVLLVSTRFAPALAKITTMMGAEVAVRAFLGSRCGAVIQ